MEVSKVQKNVLLDWTTLHIIPKFQPWLKILWSSVSPRKGAVINTRTSCCCCCSSMNCKPCNGRRNLSLNFFCYVTKASLHPAVKISTKKVILCFLFAIRKKFEEWLHFLLRLLISWLTVLCSGVSVSGTGVPFYQKRIWIFLWRLKMNVFMSPLPCIKRFCGRHFAERRWKPLFKSRYFPLKAVRKPFFALRNILLKGTIFAHCIKIANARMDHWREENPLTLIVWLAAPNNMCKWETLWSEEGIIGILIVAEMGLAGVYVDEEAYFPV